MTNGKGGTVIWHPPWHMSSHFRDAFSVGMNVSIAGSFFFSGCNQLCEQDPKLCSQLTYTYMHGIQLMCRLQNKFKNQIVVVIVLIIKQFYDSRILLKG